MNTDEQIKVLCVDDEKNVLRLLARIFLDDCPRLMSNIKNSVTENNSEALGSEAHAIKGAAGALSATRTYETAFK